MLITCPNCSTKFNLPDSAYKPGAKGRCAVCSHVFVMDGQSSGDAPAEKADLVADDFGDEFDESQLPGDDAGLDDILDDVGDSKSISFDIDGVTDGESKKKIGRWKKIAALLAGVLLLTGLTVGGVYLAAPELLGLEPSQGEAVEEGAAENFVQDIKLKNVRQYFQKNDKIGKVLVIEGKVVNMAQEDRDLIKVEARLFDQQGKTVMSRQILCGNTVSLFQLQVLTEEELNKELESRVGILAANTNVPPGGEVPFMITFANPPETVAELGVKVIEAQRPPEPEKQ